MKISLIKFPTNFVSNANATKVMIITLTLYAFASIGENIQCVSVL